MTISGSEGKARQIRTRNNNREVIRKALNQKIKDEFKAEERRKLRERVREKIIEELDRDREKDQETERRIYQGQRRGTRGLSDTAKRKEGHVFVSGCAVSLS